MAVKYDKLDLMILAELKENCKQSVRELAKKLGTHPNTLMQRIKDLDKEDVILHYSAIINFKKIGYDLHTLIFMKVSKNVRSQWNIIEDLKNVPQLVSCYTITGEYDILGIARNKDRSDLTDLLKTLNSKEYILETKTELVLEAFKHEFEYNPFGIFRSKK